MPRRAQHQDLPIALASGAPIHRALYDALRSGILEGRLRSGSKVPSSRDLARQLGVARGTVVAIYEQLVSEGYLVTRRGSGTTVAADLPDRWFRAPVPREAPSTDSPIEKRQARPIALSRFGRSQVETPFALAPRRTARPFRPHLPAVDAFPTELWARTVARRAKADERLLLGEGDVRGHAPLREVLAEHLRLTRGVSCDAEQIVILPSVQQALDLSARLTLERGDAIWMEDPGYTGARAVFRAAGAELVGVPVDDRGLDVAHGVREAPHARMVYVTPGHQAPLGVTMSIERRLELLGWAKRARALVIDDDYDSDYRYEGRPVPALQGLDKDGVVLHTGSFSKTLLHSLRIAYAVVPPSMLDAFVATKSIVDRFTPAPTQAALADFIEAGHFARHLRRMRELYAERRAALLSALAAELGGAVTVVGASAGLGIAARLPDGFDDLGLERALADADVESIALSRHALRPSERTVRGLLLGFAAYSPARLRRAVERLASVLDGLRRKRRA
ncbi:MAG TPA: PLP-dependent aminotransferase family protein [Polyangiaceae bacterium]|nr:PLP-dependent aminotransferase family protein [Polyangiaceae bacterium]